MPEIARFSGLVVAMFYRDHEPPHAHVRLAEYEATVRIEDGVVAGKLPSWARERVREWCASHRRELRDNWRRARMHSPLRRIGPVE
jgi:Domain of unknown function (DUF4160)